MIVGALLATSSAISGTMFGASRQMAAIASDGYLPSFLATRHAKIPVAAIIAMAGLAFCLILAGSLRVIFEFGSVTFLLVSMLMAYANFKIRRQTQSSTMMTILALVSLAIGTLLILYYEATAQPEQIFFIAGLYILLTAGAYLYAKTFSPGKRSENDTMPPG